jgi:hypothetical protein
MKWITREKVKVDRVACPWLIKKFIDREAEFVFLPHDTNWAGISDGIVYDVPGAELGHHGEDVSFDSIVKKYGLVDPGLKLLAEIVRAADSHPSNRIRPAKAFAGSHTASMHWVSRIMKSWRASLSSTMRFTLNATSGFNSDQFGEQKFTTFAMTEASSPACLGVARFGRVDPAQAPSCSRQTVFTLPANERSRVSAGGQTEIDLVDSCQSRRETRK